MRPPDAVGPHPAGRADELAAELAAHVDRLGQALPALRAAAPTLARWGEDLGHRLVAGGRLLAAGNGGSAAEAQHLTAELVGRFDRDRRALSAIALHADTSSLSAIGNDYGFAQVFARQVRAHARPGDVVVLFSTSGRSPNLVEAASAAAALGATSWALTGPGPNPLAHAVHRRRLPARRHRVGAGDAPRGPAHAVPGGGARGGRRAAGARRPRRPRPRRSGPGRPPARGVVTVTLRTGGGRLSSRGTPAAPGAVVSLRRGPAIRCAVRCA